MTANTSRLVLWIVAALMLAACGGGPRATPQPDTSVQWSDYAPGLQSRIDGLATAKDCPALQTEFNIADANNDATMARTGHNNARLMSYIDAKMRAAGCY